MTLTRRQWLASAAALPLAAKPYRPLLAVQLYVFQQQFNREKKSVAEGMEEAFAAVARAGYRRVEMTSAFWTPELRGRTRALLERHRLETPIVYNGGPMHSPEGAAGTIAQTLEYAAAAREAGAQAVSFNASPTKTRKTDEELAVQAKSLDELGGRLRERGMELLIHQHAPELRENAREWRYQFRHSDPARVKICLDIDWVKRGGQDVMALLRESAPRLRAAHLRNARDGVWMEELGDGDVDYRAVAGYLRETGFEGWLTVELAYEQGTRITRSLEENLRRSREYAEKIFL